MHCKMDKILQNVKFHPKYNGLDATINRRGKISLRSEGEEGEFNDF